MNPNDKGAESLTSSEISLETGEIHFLSLYNENSLRAGFRKRKSKREKKIRRTNRVERGEGRGSLFRPRGEPVLPAKIEQPPSQIFNLLSLSFALAWVNLSFDKF